MSATIPSNVEVISDRVETGDDFDSIQDVTVEFKMGDNVSEQELKSVVDDSLSDSKEAPKILQADETGAPVVPPEVAADHEEKKIEERQEAAKPSNVLHEMEVQTGS